MDPKDLYSPIHVGPANWRKIPIEIHVFDPTQTVWGMPPSSPGTIHYAVPEPCDEISLRNELYEIIEFSLAIPAPPAGPNRGQLKSVAFTKYLDRELRDFLYLDGINPIASIPDFGQVIFGQNFVTRQGKVARIVDITNKIDPEFLALVS